MIKSRFHAILNALLLRIDQKEMGLVRTCIGQRDYTARPLKGAFFSRAQQKTTPC